MPLVGEIFFDKGFVFSDGEVGEKLFVIIYANPNLDLYLVLKTTSQKKRYPTVNSIGCHSKKLVYFLPSTVYKALDRDTFIQLGEIFSYKQKDLLSGKFSGRIKSIHTLRDDIKNGILNCLKQCKEDIEQEYYELIFSKK
ncbi:MAG TPA: hypothetical protein PLI49_26775 [Leptospiraceae bacterium]|nr:hypothetical protein [Leptospiraceae bacterium]